jgi:Double-GTPase 2
MQVLYLLLILVAALFYLAYIACAVPIGAISAFAACSLGLPVAYLISLGRVLLPQDQAQPRPAAGPKLPPGADPAVVQYFYGPAVADARHALRTAYRDCRRYWRWGIRTIASAFSEDGAILTWPFGVGAAIGMAVGTVIGAVATVGCACIHLLAVGISAALVRATGTVLRIADSAVLRVKNIRMICPNPDCYQRVPYPGYECPRKRCPRRHRDIRPGRFGILRRYCQCGEPMKTLLLFGSAGMSAFCPACGHALEHRPGSAPEIVLPFFGAAGAGKTRLLLSIVVQLQLWSRKERLAVEFGDTATEGRLDNASELLSPEIATGHTPPELPRAYVIRLGARKGRRLLHMFDAAGEFYYSTTRIQELGFLGQARTFILVIDPLSVDAFWDRLLPEQQADLKAVRSAAPSPELAYQRAHQEIEAMGVRLRKTRLAVVFSRADLIEDPAGDVATWACGELGLGNLVRSARLNFSQTCFFRTAAVMTGGAVHESIPALMRWVLAGSGADLPEESP